MTDKAPREAGTVYRDPVVERCFTDTEMDFIINLLDRLKDPELYPQYNIISSLLSVYLPITYYQEREAQQ